MTVSLSFTEQGQGPPLVILHGLFGSKRNWGAVAKALAVNHHVYCLDLRNHGASPWAEDMTYQALADDVAAFIHHHDLAPCTLIGHSMGGKTAMMLALRDPKLVRRLGVVDIAPVPRETDIGTYIQVMTNVPLQSCQSRADVDKHLSAVITNSSLRQFLLQNLEREHESLRWRLNLAALDAGLEDIADFPAPPHAKYPGPSLFIIGEKSDYVQSHHMSTIKSLFPNSETTTILGAGHWVHAESQEAFLKVVEEFLNRP